MKKRWFFIVGFAACAICGAQTAEIDTPEHAKSTKQISGTNDNSTSPTNSKKKRILKAETKTKDVYFGNWTVHQFKDEFTDKMKCFASPINNSNVWTTGDHMMIISSKGRGGVKYVRSRIDDGEVKSREPTDFESSSSSARIWMSDDLMAAKRLRVQILPLIGESLIKEDINLNGIIEADLFLNEGECKEGQER